MINIFKSSKLESKQLISLIPILKSSLQKNIRRCRPKSAIKIALKLIQLE